MSIIEHMEKHLGTIAEGYEADSEGAVSVLRFENIPEKEVVTYTTLGLSEHVLKVSEFKSVRQELIFSAYREYSSDDIVSFLISFSDYICIKHDALLRGEVIGPSSSIVKGTNMNSIYASIPVLYRNDLRTYYGSDPATVFVWLIPLTDQESMYVKDRGWEDFEDALENSEVDLWDLNRPSLV